MRPLSIFLILVFLTLASRFFLGCRGDDATAREYAGLLHRAEALEQRHCRLRTSTDSLWDTTTERLAQALPTDLPAADRVVFLRARNADHIRMFRSYHELDAETRSLVDQAGRYDSILAVRVLDLAGQQQAFEREKNRFLRRVNECDQTAGRKYADQLRAAVAGACR